MSAPSAPVRRPATWLVFGIVVPMLAFAVDASMQVNPVLWGTFRGLGGGGRGGVHGRQLLVYSLLGLSMLGLVLLMVGRSRGARAVACPLLGLGVLMAGLHAVAFVPLLPLSVVGILMLGLGLLGFTPFAALAVYVHALSVAVREQHAECAGSTGRWVWAPLAGLVVPIVVTVGPYLHARSVVEGLRRADAAAVSRGFGQLGALAPLVREELVAVYLELDGPAQARMRNLFLERFDRDLHDDVGARLRVR